MEEREYRQIEAYTKEQMADAAHDILHVYRVLYQALCISKHHPEAEDDILIAACLLHDVGRDAQFKNPELCHARVGSEMAYTFLRGQGWDEERAAHVRDCVLTHRFRKSIPPETIEAKILFDADKLDVTGAIGIARTLLYNGNENEPIYTVDEENRIQLGKKSTPPSFVREYNVKLKKIYDGFYTDEAKQLAQARRASAQAFYQELLDEVNCDDLDSIVAERLQ